MSIKETLTELFYELEDTTLESNVYQLRHNYYNTFVVIDAVDPIIQAVKVPHDTEEGSTIVLFNRDCEELSDLLRKWSDVTLVGSN